MSVQKVIQIDKFYQSPDVNKVLMIIKGGSVVERLEFSPPTSEAPCLNLEPGALCWKVGSYFPMPGGLQCSMHYFPPPVNYPSQYDLGC